MWNTTYVYFKGEYLFYLVMLVGVFLGSIAQIPLKSSALEKEPQTISYFLNKKTILGYGLMIVASLLSFVAIRNIELKRGAIIETSGYLFILAISRIVFKEIITRRQYIAALLIIIGILVFNVK